MAANAVLLIAQVVIAIQASAATIQLESAVMGPTGINGGQNISENQFVGWRFEIDFPMVVTNIGGHLLGTIVDGSDNNDIFAAIVAIDSVDEFPQGEPFSTGVTRGMATFMPPLSSDEILVPFQATLTAGSYALIFGSGDLGALGKGAIPNFLNPNIQTDIDPTTTTSYIFWSQPQFPGPFIWREGLASQMRFIVQGAQLAGTADFELDGDIDAGDLSVWQTHFGATAGATIATGSADSDGDSDGADFLAWQQQFGSGVASLAGTADFELDGDIDAGDLSVWHSNFGTTAGATTATGSADNDGDTDGADFLAWQQQFGRSVPSLAASQTVPEPASIIQFAVFAAFACIRRTARI